MVRADTCLESFRRLQPALSAAADSCWSAGTRHDSGNRPAGGPARRNRVDLGRLCRDGARGQNLPPALCRKLERRRKLGQSVGTYWEGKSAGPRTATCILVDTSNTFVHTSGRTIAAVGVEDLIIVDDDNATLIARKGQTEKVKTVIGLLKDIGNASATEHSFEYRPWGMFENLLNATECKVKRLTVDPGQHLVATVPPPALGALGRRQRYRHRAAWKTTSPCHQAIPSTSRWGRSMRLAMIPISRLS